MNQVSVADRTICGTATATACFVSALPAPARPKLIASSTYQVDSQALQRTEARLEERILENIKHYGLSGVHAANSPQPPSSSKSDDDLVGGGAEAASNWQQPIHGEEDVDFAAGNKDTCVLEVRLWFLSFCNGIDTVLPYRLTTPRTLISWTA